MRAPKATNVNPAGMVTFAEPRLCWLVARLVMVMPKVTEFPPKAVVPEMDAL